MINNIHFKKLSLSQIGEFTDSLKVFFTEKSKFAFINSHFGFRPGCVHLIISQKGSGKTTLVKALLEEQIATKKILIYGTEEDTEQLSFQYQFLNEDYVNNLAILEESRVIEIYKNDKDKELKFLEKLEMTIMEFQPDIFVFDNITTSVFYNFNKNAQFVASGIKTLCKKYKIPFILVAHTGKEVRMGQYFTSSQIKGSDSICNTAEYIYNFYSIVDPIGSRVINFIFIEKARYHQDSHRGLYRLFYDRDKLNYTSDLIVNDFERFIKYFRKLPGDK